MYGELGEPADGRYGRPSDGGDREAQGGGAGRGWQLGGAGGEAVLRTRAVRDGTEAVTDKDPLSR